MPALNFRPQFADLVSSGQKTQTIRQVRKHPIKVGDTLKLYTGMRTKACRPIGDAIASSVMPITISHGLFEVFFLNDQKLNPLEALVLAQHDGFSCTYEFFNFFAKQYGTDDFNGVLIKWRLTE
jgi:uncharacterized protein YqfB (UPF0267 family)